MAYIPLYAGPEYTIFIAHLRVLRPDARVWLSVRASPSAYARDCSISILVVSVSIRAGLGLIGAGGSGLLGRNQGGGS